MKKQNNISDTIAFLLIAVLLVAFVVLILPEPSKKDQEESTDTEIEADSGEEIDQEYSYEETEIEEISSDEDTDPEDAEDSSAETASSEEEAEESSDSSSTETSAENSDTDEEDLPDTDPYFETEGDSFDDIMIKVLSALISADFDSLSDYVGGEGLRLSPMGAFLEDDIVLTSNEVADYLSMDTMRYGIYRGSGNAIRMTPVEYYNKFICPSDFDFSETSIYIDDEEDLEAAGWGDIHTVRYTYEPNVMEWQDVIMVYRENGGRDYLIGIIHRDVTTN